MCVGMVARVVEDSSGKVAMVRQRKWMERVYDTQDVKVSIHSIRSRVKWRRQPPSSCMCVFPPTSVETLSSKDTG